MTILDPKLPVQTRDGRPARIISTDKKGEHPIVYLARCNHMEDGEFIGAVHANGRLRTDDKISDYDLINSPTPPNLRPWRPEEVPVGAVWRVKESSNRWVIEDTTITLTEVHEWCWAHEQFDETAWRPCGVREEGGT